MLTDSDVLLIDQVTAFFHDDFAISDAQGIPVGQIRTEGELGMRLLAGNREFRVLDADGGTALRVVDTMDFGLDTFAVTGPDGTPLATVVKAFTFFTPRLTVVLADGTELAVRGDVFSFDYQIDGPSGRVATVARRWPSIGEAFLGHDRYVLAFEPTTSAAGRAALIGTTIALDLIRDKQRKN